jgi:nitrite reductase/ring-hydroxylating ferredoxin subunit
LSIQPFTDVAAEAGVREGEPLSVALPGGERVCLVRCGATISAFRDECPHQAMPLSAGTVLSDGTLECAWHGARFDCATGAVLKGPAEDDLITYPVSVVAGRVLVGTARTGGTR